MIENNKVPEEVTKLSKFNEAAFLMIRFHEEQTKINRVRHKPLSFFVDEMTGNLIRGYEVWLNSLISIFFEISSKLKAKELETAEEKRDEVEKLLIDKPVFETKINQPIHTQMIKPNYENWKTIKKALYDFELLIKKYKDLHKFSVPEEQNPEMAAWD